MVTSPKPLVNNVTVLKVETVFDKISTFLNRKNIGNGNKLKGTAAEYERDIKRFFQIMLNKNINQLTIEDLDKIKLSDVEKYQTFMIDSGYSSATVNRSIASMKSLYGYFQDNQLKYKNSDNEWISISASAFKVSSIVLHDDNKYGMFSHEEILEMIRLAKKYPNGERKSLFIELASVTAIRLDALVGLTLKHFRKEGTVYVVKVIDKSKEHEKAITEDLYNRLEKNSVDGKLFNFTKKTMERAINDLVEEMELDPDRNLSFHSIKKYSMGEVYRITNGDPLAVAKHGNHASFDMAMKHYLLFANQYESMPCLLIGKELDLKPMEDMTKEELLQLIQKGSRAMHYELLHILNGSERKI
jgi:integrase